MNIQFLGMDMTAHSLPLSLSAYLLVGPLVIVIHIIKAILICIMGVPSPWQEMVVNKRELYLFEKCMYNCWGMSTAAIPCL